MSVATPEPRPMLRGYLHLAAALVAPAAAFALVSNARGPSQMTGVAVFGACLSLLFSVSAAYHIPRWRPRWSRVLKRVDHSMIFVFIAGSYTPFCLEAMGVGWGTSMLVATWLIAAGGVALKVAWPDAPRWLGVGCYLAAGWLGVVALPELAANVPTAGLLLALAGGLLYSAGAVIYAVKWPNPFPRVLGHHEIFHAFVVAGGAVLYSVVAVFLLG